MKASLHNTLNDIPQKTRLKMIESLNQSLADGLDLSLQAKQAHWNVKGPSFIALHELFDEVVDDLKGYVDEIAERTVQLGGTAEGTLQAAARKTALPVYPLDITSGREHVKALSESLAKFGKSIRAVIDEAADVSDAGTADLLTEVSRGVDKLLWKVEAHAQTKE